MEKKRKIFISRLNFITNPFLRHVGVMRGNMKEKIEENGGRLFLTRDPLEIMPGVLTTGEVKRITDRAIQGFW
ncbi:hypothetical protein [Caldanaerobacter subterraneus]|jgi:7,8-dihydropterin-6-yl-methyl-4-(beta-D-ribofuranosyl)aminobenzene 5'-phosphate synthase